MAAAVVVMGPPDEEPRSLVVEVVDGTGADCMTPEALHELIAETLDRPVTRPGPDVTADATATVVTRTGELGREASITAIDATGAKMERTLTLEDERCRELLDSVALVTGLLLDELWQENRVLVVPPPEPPSAVPPKPEPQPEPSEAPASSGWTVFVGVGAAASYRDLPTFSAGPALRTEFASPRVVSFGLAAAGWPRAIARVDGGGSARFAAFDAGVFVCPRILDRPQFGLLSCVTGRAGFVSAVGEDLAVPGGATRPRALVDLGLATRVLLGGPVWLRIGLDASIPIVRDEFEVLSAAGDPVTVHRSWPVLPTAQVSVEIRANVAKRSQVRAGRQKK
jgi:hypothetical protein